jgi:hypothetical protein
MKKPLQTIQQERLNGLCSTLAQTQAKLAAMIKE